MGFRELPAKRGHSRATDVPLLERLRASSSARIAEKLAGAVMEAVPERHREATDREC